MTVSSSAAGRSARVRRQRGSTLVEQAIILPILLTVMFGTIDLARALYTYTYVSYIAREATRWASVRSFNLNGGGPVTQAQVTAFVKDVNGMGLDATKLSGTMIWLPPPNGSPLCPAGAQKPGCVVQVTVTYNFNFTLPFLPTGPIPMSSVSQMIATQ